MNNISLRNVLILLGAVIVVLLALGFISTVLNQVVPITLALIVGVVLGRMSVNVNLVSVVKDALHRQPAAKPQATQTAVQSQSQEQTLPDEQARAEVEAIKRRIADVDSEPKQEAEVTDFKIKTEEEIQAEARRLEDEVAKRNASYDPAAALAERRKRLLGDQADQS
jgi:hypothetical protein